MNRYGTVTGQKSYSKNNENVTIIKIFFVKIVTDEKTYRKLTNLKTKNKIVKHIQEPQKH
jgi:transcriptional regulator of met regulon